MVVYSAERQQRLEDEQHSSCCNKKCFSPHEIVSGCFYQKGLAFAASLSNNVGSSFPKLGRPHPKRGFYPPSRSFFSYITLFLSHGVLPSIESSLSLSRLILKGVQFLCFSKLSLLNSSLTTSSSTFSLSLSLLIQFFVRTLFKF